MQSRRMERAVLTTFFLGACVTFGGACVAIGHAYGAGTAPMVLAQTNIPQSPEAPVSPTTPGTLPGTTAGPGTSVGTNPVTGQPCLGGGSSAINGGIIGAPTTQGQPSQPGTNTTGLPPSNSVYGLNNSTSSGSC
jgi:hypothetical protein